MTARDVLSLAWIRRMDPVTCAGVGLLVVSLVVHVLVIGPLEADGEALRVAHDAREAQVRMDGGRRPGNAGAAERMARYYASFPTPDTSPHWLERIDAAAVAHGLVLESGEYRLERRPEQRIVRYQMVLPVTGSYAQIRGFMAEVLREVPAAAVEDVQMKREDVRSAPLQATIRLTLHLNAGARP